VNAYEYWRAMHPFVTKEDYKGFAARYRGSEEEAQDLLDYFANNEGDVTDIL